MKRPAFLSFSFIITFIWFGFVGAISFMEAPVKFTAPSLTLAIGLDVGRHVFAALNKAEIVFAFASLIVLFIARPPLKIMAISGGIGLILLLQTIWLLPALDARARIIIDGGMPPASSLHLLYIVVEALKLAALFVLGCWQVGYFISVITANSVQPRHKKVA